MPDVEIELAPDVDRLGNTPIYNGVFLWLGAVLKRLWGLGAGVRSLQVTLIVPTMATACLTEDVIVRVATIMHATCRLDRACDGFRNASTVWPEEWGRLKLRLLCHHTAAPLCCSSERTTALKKAIARGCPRIDFEAHHDYEAEEKAEGEEKE